MGPLKVKSFIVPSGTDVSNVITTSDLMFANQITIYGPSSLDSTTWTILVSADNGTSFQTLCKDDGTTALPLPGADKARAYLFELGASTQIKLKGAGNVAADREWMVVINENGSGGI